MECGGVQRNPSRCFCPGLGVREPSPLPVLSNCSFHLSPLRLCLCLLTMVTTSCMELVTHTHIRALWNYCTMGNARKQLMCCFQLFTPDVHTAVSSLIVMWDGSMVVAANNDGTCYIWLLLKDAQAHDGYIVRCLLSPQICDPNRYFAKAASDQTVKICRSNAGFAAVFSIDSTVLIQ